MGWQPNNHLKKQYSQSVVVNRVTIKFTRQDLRAHILRTTYKTRRQVFPWKIDFAKAEICKFQMASLVNQNVFRLQISVQNIFLV